MFVEVIEVSKLKDERQWHEVRSTGIGGSDAASIYNKGWTSAYTLWAQKSGVVERVDNPNEAMRWGHKLERPVAEMFAEDFQAAVVYWPVILRSVAHPTMLANVDYWLVEPSEQFPVGQVTDWSGGKEPPGIVSLLEIKTTGIAGYGNSSGWEDDDVPEHNEIQGLHYASTTGVPEVVFAALVGGVGLVVRGRFYDPEMCINHVHKVAEFWRLVETGEAPDPDGSLSSVDTIKSLFPRSAPNVIIEADDFVMETYERWVKAKAELEDKEGIVRSLRAKLEIAIGAGEEMVYNGGTLFTYKNNKDGTKLDAKRLAAEQPGIVAAYQTPVEGARIFRKVEK